MSRYVTVGSVSESRPVYSRDEAEPFLEHLEKFVWRASKMGCEILAFPEAHYRPEGKYPDVAEEIGGRGGSWAMEMARKYDLHLIWPMVTFEDGTSRGYNNFQWSPTQVSDGWLRLYTGLDQILELV